MFAPNTLTVAILFSHSCSSQFHRGHLTLTLISLSSHSHAHLTLTFISLSSHSHIHLTPVSFSSPPFAGGKNAICCCLPLMSRLTNKCQPSLQAPPSHLNHHCKHHPAITASTTQPPQPSLQAPPSHLKHHCKNVPQGSTHFTPENGPERGLAGAVPAVENRSEVPAPVKCPASSCSGKVPNLTEASQGSCMEGLYVVMSSP